MLQLAENHADVMDLAWSHADLAAWGPATAYSLHPATDPGFILCWTLNLTRDRPRGWGSPRRGR